MPADYKFVLAFRSTIRDRMFLGIQDFDFAQIYSLLPIFRFNFAQKIFARGCGIPCMLPQLLRHYVRPTLIRSACGFVTYNVPNQNHFKTGSRQQRNGNHDKLVE